MKPLLLIALLGGLGQDPVTAPARPPKDFAVRLSFGCATMDVIDTFKHQYIREVGPQYWGASTWFSFSRKEKQEVYQLFVQIDFFEIPTDFRPAGAQGVEPSSRYELKVRSGGRQHQITWSDPGEELGSQAPEAVALRRLIYRVVRIAHRNALVERLPQSTLLCM